MNIRKCFQMNGYDSDGIYNLEYHFMIFQVLHTWLLKVYLSYTGYTVFQRVYLLWTQKVLPYEQVILHALFYDHFSSEIT